MSPTNLVAFLASLGVGCGVLYANPKRAINRAFFLASVDVAAWLLSLEWLTDPANPNPVFWLRVTCAIGALIPFLVWIINDCAKGGSFGWRSVLDGWVWLAVGLSMAVLCFSHYFIPPESTRDHPTRGLGWNAYIFVMGGSYLTLLLQTLASLRTRVGIQKIELQVLLLGGTAAGFMGVALSALGPVLGNPTLPHLIPIVIFVFYAFTAWGITTQKVFDARQLFRSGIQISLSIGIVSALVSLALLVDPDLVPRPLVIIFCSILITLLFNRFNIQILRATQLGGDRDAEAVRTAILAAGRDEFDHKILVKRF
ncbi:MAG TPA: hypothetical protein VKG78_06490, partial [Opitutaceae bacterium]|nr:hypothetical protein [Opitutaceae bacterium]